MIYWHVCIIYVYIYIYIYIIYIHIEIWHILARKVSSGSTMKVWKTLFFDPSDTPKKEPIRTNRNFRFLFVVEYWDLPDKCGICLQLLLPREAPAFWWPMPQPPWWTWHRAMRFPGIRCQEIHRIYTSCIYIYTYISGIYTLYIYI